MVKHIEDSDHHDSQKQLKQKKAVPGPPIIINCRNPKGMLATPLPTRSSHHNPLESEDESTKDIKRISKDTPSQIEGLRLRNFFFPFLLTILASEWGQHYPHAGSIYRCFSEFWLMLDGARLLNQIEDTIVFPLKFGESDETHRRYYPP